MTEANRLAQAIVRTVDGPMWHGPALGELLRDVTAEEASAHPIATGHSIWELVLHIATWAEVPRARLTGDPRKNVSADEDWPRPPRPSSGAWKEAVTALEAAYHALASDVAALDSSALDTLVPGHDYSVREMMHGVIEHGTYHGGQIALLKKAAR
jgi:uncharacterized damage-inducible protein DinB